MELSPIQNAILETLSYANIFDAPLTQTQIQERLIFNTEINAISLQNELKSLEKNQYIQKDKDYFSLKNNDLAKPISAGKLQEQKAKNSQQKIEYSKLHLQKLLKCPWILGIFITGSVAAQNANLEDDIDVMIITRNQRLWLTRIWIALLFNKKMRRTANAPQPWTNQFCFNLFLEQSHIKIQEKKQNLYTAYECVLITPLFEKEEIYCQFWQQNNWIQNSLYPTYQKRLKTCLSQKRNFQQRNENILKSYLLNILNLIAYFLQRIYMFPKMTLEDVTLQSAFFHPKDLTKSVLKAFFRMKTPISLI